MDLLDPKNDYVFKRLFADSPELLAELISAVRKDEPPLEVLEVLNPLILPEDLDGKPIELDVLARDETGRLFNVEVQVLRHPRPSSEPRAKQDGHPECSDRRRRARSAVPGPQQHLPAPLAEQWA